MKTDNKAYLGLGSNLANPSQQIALAVQHLAAVKNIQLIAQSKNYQTKALVPADRPDEIQPDFINAVLAIETSLSPLELLQQCQQIEHQMGRIRSGKRWEARIIDIDLLLFADVVIASDVLTLPHPEIKNRRFVLQPLFEIAPDLILPDGNAVKDLLKKM